MKDEQDQRMEGLYKNKKILKITFKEREKRDQKHKLGKRKIKK